MTSQNPLLSQLNDNCLLPFVLSNVLLGIIFIITKKLAGRSETKNHGQDLSLSRRRPCPSSVPIPVPQFMAEPLQEKLPIMTYKSFLEQTRKSRTHDYDDGDESSCVCIVCMDCMASGDMVRVPFNCCHAFHRECMDGWIGEGHATCPLCRSKLLPETYQSSEKSGLGFGSPDPWRIERMVYLFGEDYMI